MSFDTVFNEANTYYLNGAYQEAERLCQALLAFAPENPHVLNMLGLIAAAKGEHQTAVLYFNDALKKAPNKLPIYFSLAVSTAELGKTDAAIEAYQEVLKLAPNTKEAWNNLGALYEKKADLIKAEECYQKAILLDENYVDALVNLAVLKTDLPALEALALRFEKSALPFYYLADFAMQNKQFPKAFEYALKADQKEEAFDIKWLLARLYEVLADKENAIKYSHQALLLNPKSVDVLVMLATMEENEDDFKLALSLDPKSYQAHLRYADFLYKNKRIIESVEEYHKALLNGAEDAALSNNVGLILKDLGDEKRALDLMMNAFIKAPLNTDISINIAETLVLLYQKEPAEALRIAKLWALNAKDNVFASHTLAAFEKNPSHRDEAYAKALFDEFADIYDAKMQNIHYAVFDKIKELGILPTGRVLDLGCGTGLAAFYLKTPSASWTGVDISSKMLQKAKEKGLYQELSESDALAYLKQNGQNFDEIFCLDVAEYIPNIEELITLCFPAKLILSFEVAGDDVKTYQISPTGRYQHNPDFIENAFKNAGYGKIAKHPLVLRKENGADVKGFLFIGEI